MRASSPQTQVFIRARPDLDPPAKTSHSLVRVAQVSLFTSESQSVSLYLSESGAKFTLNRVVRHMALRKSGNGGQNECFSLRSLGTKVS